MTIRRRQWSRLNPTSPERVPEAPIDADILRIPVGPGALHVDRYGHGGTPVVLIHGFGTSSFLWRNVGAASALARHTAIANDLLGYGESDRPYEAEFDIASQAEYVDRALTALRVARGVVVGIDVGGGVALRLAAARPERVERLVLINSVAFDCYPGKDIRGLQRNTARFALRISKGVLGAAPLLTPILEQSVTSAERMPPRLQARYLAPYVGPEGVSHLLTLARSVHAEDLEDLDLRGIAAPTLVVWGEEDPFLDDKIPDRLINAIPDARLVRLPSVGRLVPEEAPDELARMILEFMAGRGIF
jgi:pimeloyl-ACP methyl ester carboxylesterase